MVAKDDTTVFERLDVGEARATSRDALLDKVLAKLFRQTTSFSRDALEGGRFEDARGLLKTTLQEQYADRLFDFHSPQANRGLMLWLLYTTLCVASAWLQDPMNAGSIFLAFMFAIPATAALTGIYASWRKNGFSFLGFLLTVFVLSFLLAGLTELLSATRPFVWDALPGALPLVLLVVAIRAYGFLKGYNEAGHAVMDEIAGFRQYLTLAEGPRLHALVTPEAKLEVYERFLPYAVALDVGEAWAAAFSGLFAELAPTAAFRDMQQMYGGHDMLNGNPSHSIRDISSEMNAPSAERIPSSDRSPGTSDRSSSSRSSSSSSGSSGGGSSGGGGGGGGGSGW
jgi:uncharacterized membrane protein YgcG